ncbi:MAG: D-Ala-D-Ala carboxypeptidase family metallohydrolase, partial [Leptolyngbya sp.]|nr:D-Ala-D-Ala carboxypeptidase family metallohydrolase [Leptolyngbya sp.]
LARARFYGQTLGQLLPPLVATPDFDPAPQGAPGRPYLAESCHITALADCDVRWVQEQLKRGGYYSGRLDGQVGPQTRDAFRQFKQDYCLEYPQLIGATTIDALAELKEMKGDPNDLQLSENFKLSEMLRSQTAQRRGIKNYPSNPEHIENLKALCQNILEPVRKHFGMPISPSSGYRCPELNAAVGGVSNSQHAVGEAVDFVVPKASIPTVCRWIRDNLEFDQLIMEKYNPRTGSGWIHCSYKRKGRNRNRFFSVR